MIHIAICDDETAELSNIVQIIEQYIIYSQVGIRYTTFQNSFDLLSAIDCGQHFDLIMLDIIMPQHNGMDVAREIRKTNNSMDIIFLTSSPEFAVESYTVGALNYVLKPIWKEKLFSVLDNALDKMQLSQEKNIFIKNRDGITKIALSNIEYCEVINKNILYHLINGKTIEIFGVFSTLVENLLKYPQFLKPHRSYILNMNHIESITAKKVLMHSMAEIPISRGLSAFVKEQYLNYYFMGGDN